MDVASARDLSSVTPLYLGLCVVGIMLTSAGTSIRSDVLPCAVCRVKDYQCTLSKSAHLCLGLLHSMEACDFYTRRVLTQCNG